MEEGVGRARLEPGAVPDRFVSLRRQLGVSSFGINQMVMEPGQRSRIHVHAQQEEVYLVLDGELTLLVDGEPVVLGAGELARVAPSVRRQLVNRGARRLSLLALGGHGEHQGRDATAYRDWDDTTGGSPAEIPLPEDLPV